MNLPTKLECEQIIKKFNVPTKRHNHMKLVTKIALFLGYEFKNSEININFDLLEKSAILHDIDKYLTVNEKYKHGEIAYNFLNEKYPELATVILSHVKGWKDQKLLDTWEKKILFYADKSVKESEILHYKHRIEYVKNKNEMITKEKIKQLNSELLIVQQIEKEIFEFLDFKPDELEEKLNEHINKKR